MLIIDDNGQYAYVDGTRKLATSDHPVYRARIELALPLGTWCFAPNSGFDRAAFARVKQTDAKVDEYRKAVALYLKKYGPEIVDTLLLRPGVTIDFTIPDEVVNVLL